LVGICLPAYNDAAFIGSAWYPVLQKYQNTEILIGDDARMTKRHGHPGPSDLEYVTFEIRPTWASLRMSIRYLISGSSSQSTTPMTL
jgi:hypothetical protein